MICKNCGKEIVDNAKFCSECGETIEKSDNSEQIAENSNTDFSTNDAPAVKSIKNKKIITSVLICVAIVFLFIAFKNINTPSTSNNNANNETNNTTIEEDNFGNKETVTAIEQETTKPPLSDVEFIYPDELSAAHSTYKIINYSIIPDPELDDYAEIMIEISCVSPYDENKEYDTFSVIDIFFYDAEGNYLASENLYLPIGYEEEAMKKGDTKKITVPLILDFDINDVAKIEIQD